jgi:hypothetical protein
MEDRARAPGVAAIPAAELRLRAAQAGEQGGARKRASLPHSGVKELAIACPHSAADLELTIRGVVQPA